MSLSARVRRAPVAVLSVLAVLAAGLVAAAPAQAAASDLFFSEYIEGTGFNKAIEIFNGTGADVPLSGYSLELYSNGSPTVSQSRALTGTVKNGDVFIAAHSSADPALLATADVITINIVINWNGDDAIVLRKGTTIIDSIGQVGHDPGTEWGTGLTSTADNTLRRKSAVLGGDTTTSDAFDPSVEWNGFAVNTFNGFGWHVADGAESAPAVTATSPARNAADVPLDSNVTVTFSEPVSVTASSFGLTCTTSGNHALSVNGGTTTYSLDPVTDFVGDESCTLTVVAEDVDDVDSNDPPSGMAANYVTSFGTEPPPPSCDVLPTHTISQVQGDGGTSPVLDQGVTVQAVVTAIRPSLNGFFIQEETGDQDSFATTSEGVFVLKLPAGQRRRRRPCHGQGRRS